MISYVSDWNSLLLIENVRLRCGRVGLERSVLIAQHEHDCVHSWKHREDLEAHPRLPAGPKSANLTADEAAERACSVPESADEFNEAGHALRSRKASPSGATSNSAKAKSDSEAASKMKPT